MQAVHETIEHERCNHHHKDQLWWIPRVDRASQCYPRAPSGQDRNYWTCQSQIGAHQFENKTQGCGLPSRCHATKLPRKGRPFMLSVPNQYGKREGADECDGEPELPGAEPTPAGRAAQEP